MIDVRTEKEEMIFSYYAERMMFCLMDSSDSSAALQVDLSISWIGGALILSLKG